MSFDISWIASADIPSIELEGRLGLRRTGRTYQDRECDYSSVRLSNGWITVVTNRVDFLETLDLAFVSKAGHIITLALHEGIMISIAQAWTNGQRDWQVQHDGQKHIQHLEAFGRLPESFASAKTKCEDAIRTHVPYRAGTNLPEMPPSERAIFERMGLKVEPFGATPRRVDFHFNIPIDLAHSFVEFRYNIRPRGLTFYDLHHEDVGPLEQQG